MIDTWSWVEYWRGRNETVRKYIDGPGEKLTSVITIAELERKFGRDADEMDAMIREIRQKSRIIPLHADLARIAGSVRRDMKEGGIGDAIIYATALRHKARVLTGDPHFRVFPDVIMA